ncbi:LOB domain-containing protein 9 [Nymphaea thermarum]|nr:LOB domain-containing protein 9 [Nymphaea thermarum]
MQSADHPFPSSSSPSSPKPLPISSPCAACKVLRRRCSKQCTLAPYFPPSEPEKFITAHRVFGASNIVKLLQEVPESQRADAASSLVYEANARSRNRVYGCAGTIFQLQKQLSELQSQLAAAKAKIHNMRNQQAHLAALFCMQKTESKEPTFQPTEMFVASNDIACQPYLQLGNFADADIGSLFDTLWT